MSAARFYHLFKARLFSRKLQYTLTMAPKRKSKSNEEVATSSKKTKTETEDVKGEEESQESPKPKSKKQSSIVIEPVPEGQDTSFPIEYDANKLTSDGRKSNFKIASWNVNGIRAWLEKDGLSYLEKEMPDALCIQETKCPEDKIPPSALNSNYHAYWSSAEQAGYAGTGIYSKKEPICVTYGIGKEEHDKEGRVITAEYEKFYLVTAYVPNSGRGLVRLKYRSKEWDVDFRNYLKDLDKKKPVVLCGDLNVAHTPVDLKNPKTNQKTAGFSVEEREGFTNLLNEGFIDSFRVLYPWARDCFTFWTYMGNAREKNVGWRLDYFVVSERMKGDICDSIIQNKYMGSDHCPIMLSLAL